MTDKLKQPKRVGVREDIFTMPLHPAEQVKLKGSQCHVCGEIFLGKHLSCGNCAQEKMGEITLSTNGKLWTYTVVRNRPPGDYKGPDPFVPFAEGLIELPEGIRLLSPLTECDVDNLAIGSDWQLVVAPLYTDDEGNEVMSFKFRPL